MKLVQIDKYTNLTLFHLVKAAFSYNVFLYAYYLAFLYFYLCSYKSFSFNAPLSYLAF